MRLMSRRVRLGGFIVFEFLGGQGDGKDWSSADDGFLVIGGAS